jgi:hypothetical protein
MSEAQAFRDLNMVRPYEVTIRMAMRFDQVAPVLGRKDDAEEAADV